MKTQDITDIAPLADIRKLLFRPAIRAGSAHLMTLDELLHAIAEMRQRCEQNPKCQSARDSLAAFEAEEERRLTESSEERGYRLRQRLAWEFTQLKKERRTRPYSASAAPAARYLA